MRPPTELAADLRRLADELDPPYLHAGQSLQAALDQGGTIRLEPGGVWEGSYVITQPGTTLIGGTIRGNVNDLLMVRANNVLIEGVAIEGDPVLGAKRGIQLDGANVTVTGCVVRNIFRVGQDSQAIAGWNGPGPYTIEYNILEAASENILFGGADPKVPGTIPSDIVIQSNTLTKDPAWAGKGYNVKNLLELKSARRVTITGNLLEHTWVDGQVGFALVFTPVNQDGTHPTAEVSDVLVEKNLIRDAAASIQLARNGYTLARLTFQHNLFETTGIGSNKNILILGGPSDLVLEQNTFRASRHTEASWIYGYDGPVSGFRAVGNLVRVTGEYGICTQGVCGGRAWREFFPNGVIEGNALEGFPQPANLPGNVFLNAGDPDPVGYGR